MAMKVDEVRRASAVLSALKPKRKPGGKPFGTAQPVPKGVPFVKGDDPRRYNPRDYAGTSAAPKEFRRLCQAEALELAPHMGTRIRAGKVSAAQVAGFRALAEHGHLPSITRVEHTGEDGAPMALDLPGVSDDVVVRVAAALAPDVLAARAKKVEP